MIPQFVIGATLLFTAAMDGNVQLRSNAGAVMFDTFPALPTNTVIAVKNIDSAALWQGSWPGGYFLLGPDQYGQFITDGASWFSLTHPTRIQFRSDTTIYVGQSGSDNNSGISAAFPFKTIQAAMDALFMRYDHGGHSLRVKVANSATPYAGFSIRGAMTGHYGNPSIVNPNAPTFSLEGNVSDPSQVVINGVEVVVGKSLHMDGVTLQNAGGNGVLANLPGTEVVLHRVNFGVCAGAHIMVAGNAAVLLQEDIHVYGNAAQFIYAEQGATVQNSFARTVTFHGSRTFSGFVIGAARNASIALGLTSFAGSVTGQRWKTLLNGTVDVGPGVNPDTRIPGTINGSNNYGGQTWYP